MRGTARGTRRTGRDMRVLGIETSCDETAAAVVALEGGTARILSDVVLSQTDEHAAFGGVVPEIAARAHVSALDGIVRAALDDAGLALPDLDGVAVTAGPGLIGGLMVGTATARALAAPHGLPVVGVNHLEGHALTPRLTDGVPFPYLLLLVSGGHTQIVEVRGLAEYERWGTTIDDALGEAFDKTAKLLGLGYPGGPAVERLATSGDPRAFDLPRPMKGHASLDLSFSGLKTAVRRAAMGAAPLDERTIADLCASFQAAVADVLGDRLTRAMARFSDLHGTGTLVVAGGVAANRFLRARIETAAKEKGFAFVAPPARLCTDNAAMIAHAGALRLAAGLIEPPSPRPRWPLDGAASPRVGSGKRGAKA